MAGKSRGAATTAAERKERVDFTVGLLCRTGRATDARGAIVKQFSCDRRTAGRYIRAAKTLIGADLPEIVQANRANVRLMLQEIIDDRKMSPTARLQALRQLVDLLGLAAPQRLAIEATAVPFDPLAAYANDPSLMERALKLEGDIYDADKALDSLNAGQNRISELAVPPAYPPPGSNGNGTPVKPDDESADSGDSGSPR